MYRCNQLRTTWIIDFHRLKPVKLPIKKIRKVLRQKSAPPLRLLRGSGQKAQALHSSPAPRALSGPRAGRDAWRNWSRPAVTLNPPPLSSLCGPRSAARSGCCSWQAGLLALHFILSTNCGQRAPRATGPRPGPAELRPSPSRQPGPWPGAEAVTASGQGTATPPSGGGDRGGVET